MTYRCFVVPVIERNTVMDKHEVNEDPDGLGSCRDILNGCLLSIPLWLFIGFIVWAALK